MTAVSSGGRARSLSSMAAAAAAAAAATTAAAAVQGGCTTWTQLTGSAAVYMSTAASTVTLRVALSLVMPRRDVLKRRTSCDP